MLQPEGLFTDLAIEGALGLSWEADDPLAGNCWAEIQRLASSERMITDYTATLEEIRESMSPALRAATVRMSFMCLACVGMVINLVVLASGDTL